VGEAMIDLFALVLAHSLLALAAWRLVLRNDLDANPAAADVRKRAARESSGDA
jgi:hypothetical protein